MPGFLTHSNWEMKNVCCFKQLSFEVTCSTAIYNEKCSHGGINSPQEIASDLGYTNSFNFSLGFNHRFNRTLATTAASTPGEEKVLALFKMCIGLGMA
jgi:AraC-like DNA-binding protein